MRYIFPWCVQLSLATPIIIDCENFSFSLISCSLYFCCLFFFVVAHSQSRLTDFLYFVHLIGFDNILIEVSIED